jgi:hypothetical protein
MNQDEIKAKSSELATLYTAKANGKTLQCFLRLDPKKGCWIDHDNGSGPSLHSDLSKWRVKPEPQRIWISGTAWTDSPVIAAALREQGQEAREFVEVIP